MGKMTFVAAVLALPLAAPVFAAEPLNLSPSPDMLSMPSATGQAHGRDGHRIDIFQLTDETAADRLQLPGIPFISTGSAAKRERGFSFSIRPVKGVKAIARFRF